MGNLNFDASQVKPNTAFDPLPPSWYTMRIVGAELVPSEKAGNMLKIEHEIDEHTHPEFANRKVFSNLCINHPNDQPREIARRTLSAIAHAINILQVDDTSVLLGQTLLVKVKSVPAKDGYDAKNEVSGYKSLKDREEPSGSSPTVAGANGTAAPATQAAKPSWKK